MHHCMILSSQRPRLGKFTFTLNHDCRSEQRPMYLHMRRGPAQLALRVQFLAFSTPATGTWVISPLLPSRTWQRPAAPASILLHNQSRRASLEPGFSHRDKTCLPRRTAPRWRRTPWPASRISPLQTPWARGCWAPRQPFCEYFASAEERLA